MKNSQNSFWLEKKLFNPPFKLYHLKSCGSKQQPWNGILLYDAIYLFIYMSYLFNAILEPMKSRSKPSAFPRVSTLEQVIYSQNNVGWWKTAFTT